MSTKKFVRTILYKTVDSAVRPVLVIPDPPFDAGAKVILAACEILVHQIA